MSTVPVFVTLPYETVQRILFVAEGYQAARAVGGSRDSPIASNSKKLPPLSEGVVDVLKRLHPGGLRNAEYTVTLQRDDAAVLRDWLRQVGPLLKSVTEQVLFLAAAETMDRAIQQSPQTKPLTPRSPQPLT